MPLSEQRHFLIGKAVSALLKPIWQAFPGVAFARRSRNTNGKYVASRFLIFYGYAFENFSELDTDRSRGVRIFLETRPADDDLRQALVPNFIESPGIVEADDRIALGLPMFASTSQDGLHRGLTFRPDSRHKQKGSSTDLRTTIRVLTGPSVVPSLGERMFAKPDVKKIHHFAS